MMVSDKMVEVLEYVDRNIWASDYSKVCQEVVNAAWTEFKADDESTWPKYNADYFLQLWPDSPANVVLTGDHWYFGIRHWRDKKFYGMVYTGKFYYADPQDLMFNKEV